MNNKIDKLIENLQNIQIENKNNRPTFYYMPIPNPIRAGGILLYKYDKNVKQLMFLMCKYNNDKFYSDFGGKTDKKDKYYQDTISREAFEESNEILPIEYTSKLMNKKNGRYIIYNKLCKYIYYICETNNNYKVIDFGKKEIFLNIPRTVHWVSSDDIINHKVNIHYRLKCRKLYNSIKSIKKKFNL